MFQFRHPYVGHLIHPFHSSNHSRAEGKRSAQWLTINDIEDYRHFVLKPTRTEIIVCCGMHLSTAVSGAFWIVSSHRIQSARQICNSAFSYISSFASMICRSACLIDLTSTSNISAHRAGDLPEDACVLSESTTKSLSSIYRPFILLYGWPTSMLQFFRFRKWDTFLKSEPHDPANR